VTAIASMAATFWRTAGGAPPFPRSIEEPLLWTFPVAVVRLPRLGLSGVKAYLAGVQVPCPFTGPDRRIRACLVARRGEALVFLDGTDPLDEQRFSLAHEASHFLLDYHRPRQAALRRLGRDILPVLNGERPPLPAERIDAVLLGVTVQIYGHMMDRGWSGEVVHMQTLEAEDRADRLALELLAPWAAVVAVATATGLAFDNAEAGAAIARIIQGSFGLPGPVAARYSPLVLSGLRRPQSFRQWLGVPRD